MLLPEELEKDSALYFRQIAKQYKIKDVYDLADNYVNKTFMSIAYSKDIVTLGIGEIIDLFSRNELEILKEDPVRVFIFISLA